MPEFNEDVTIQAHDLTLMDTGDNGVVHLDDDGSIVAGVRGQEGRVIVNDSAGRPMIVADGAGASLAVGGEPNGGDFSLLDAAGREVLAAHAEDATLYVGADGNEGDVFVRDGGGRDVIHLNGNTAALVVGADGNEGDVFVRDSAGVDRIHLNGNSGDIKLMGADIAEEFAARGQLEPGSVVVAVGPDEVTAAAVPLDRRVVGVVSGGGDFRTALHLGIRPEAGRVPVAVFGRVSCRVDARCQAIRTGDLLTTSATAGYAVRVDDPAAAAGAIFGKALAALASGTGVIPVLLTLR
jgi:hypothetical protein